MSNRADPFTKQRQAALADRLEILNRRGLVMRDEFPDLWRALDVLSNFYECGAELLEPEELLHQQADSVYLNQIQKKELDYACMLCRNQRPPLS